MYKSFRKVFQFKITLLDIEPEIWRQIQVPENYSFWDLHVALQDSMGWCDYHLHEFQIQQAGVNFRIGIPIDDEFFNDESLEAGWEIMVSEYFCEKGDSAHYVYDFGDHWRHHLELEGILSRSKNTRYPKCVGGERACPPEDCGSVPGYEELLEIIADPQHEEFYNTVEWLNGHVKKYWPYQPDYFDPKKVKFDDPHER